MLSVRIRREASGSCCGNPAGRSKGARSKLGEAFLDALLADFTERGVEAINRVREHARSISAHYREFDPKRGSRGGRCTAIRECGGHICECQRDKKRTSVD